MLARSPRLVRWAREYPNLAPLEVDGIFGKKSLSKKASIRGHSCVLADGQADPVYKYIADLTGDPVSPRNLTIYTRVSGFTMYKLAKDIVAFYGKMLDDEELPPEVQAGLRVRTR